jgi:hypothetical protein
VYKPLLPCALEKRNFENEKLGLSDLSLPNEISQYEIPKIPKRDPEDIPTPSTSHSKIMKSFLVTGLWSYYRGNSRVQQSRLTAEGVTMALRFKGV